MLEGELRWIRGDLAESPAASSSLKPPAVPAQRAHGLVGFALVGMAALRPIYAR